MLSVTCVNGCFLVHLRKRLFFSQRVFALSINHAFYSRADFFFFYVLKVLYMFGLVSLNGRCVASLRP